MSNFEILLDKLDAFARKFYLNKMLRGGIYLSAVFLTLFLIFNLLEFRFYLPSPVRMLMSYGFVALFLFFTYRWLIDPALKYFKLGKRISHEQSAKIIGDHFGEIQDKLLNILQLKNQPSSDLLMASIEQKAQKIKLIPVQQAVNLNENRPYVKYAVAPLAILALLLFKWPEVITDSTYRLVKSQEEFERKAPFEFVFDAPTSPALQSSDVPIHLSLLGDRLPTEVDILVDGLRYRMSRDNPDSYQFILPNIQKTASIQFEALGFASESYDIEVMPLPQLLGFEMTIKSPQYTGRNTEHIENTGNALVPYGSQISWHIAAKNSDHISLLPFDKMTDEDVLDHRERLFSSQTYSLVYGKKGLNIHDTLNYEIVVIPDKYPSIRVQEFVDSSQSDSDFRFFAGEVQDDYGISRLELVTEILDPNHRIIRSDSTIINDVLVRDVFSYQLSVPELNLDAGQTANVFFVVYDNDGIRGPKSTKSQVFTSYRMSEFEMHEAEENAEDAIVELSKELQEKQSQVRKSAEELKNELRQKKKMSWQDNKKLDELIQQQNQIQQKSLELQSLFDQLQEQNSQKSDQQDNKEKEEILEKLVEQATDDKLNELLEKIKELLEKKQKNNSAQQLDEAVNQSKQQELNFEKLNELYKQLEVETDLQEQINKLEDLAKEQQKLSESEEPNPEEQEEIMEKFEDVAEEMDKIQEKNEELKRPMELPDPQSDENEVKMEMNEAQKNNNQEGDQQKRQKSQKNAGDKMQSMANQMQNAMQASQQDQTQEDMEMIRQLLENLVFLSFNQERIFKSTQGLNSRSPEYKNLVREEFKTKQDWGLVRDSLIELSLRQPKIESFITDVMHDVDHSFNQVVDFLEDRNPSTANVHQRRIMTGMNDIALMLDESLQNLQQHMAQESNPSAMCNKPNKNGKSGKPSFKKISQGQKQLTEEMMKMHEQYKRAQKEGQEKGESDQQKEGEKSGGQSGSSKNYAQMAAKQKELRKALEDKAKELQGAGQGNKQMLDVIEEMDKIETDLVNKTLTNEMIQRQQEIITRLLEAEKAEREQDMDDKRKSTTAVQLKPESLPLELEEYLKNRLNQKVEYKSLPAELKPFYQRFLEQYYDNLKS